MTELSNISSTSRMARWSLLFALSVLAAFILWYFQFPAVMLIGPMLVAIALAGLGASVQMPAPPMQFAQGIIGCLLASSMRADLVPDLIGHAWLYASVTVLVIGTSVSLGWSMARLGVMPGTTAVWGSMPGAATAMVFMAGACGADIRLVASMQYVRVAIVGLTASLVAKLFMGSLPAPSMAPGDLWALWFPPVHPVPLLVTLALVTGGIRIGRAIRLPAGPMLVPMVLAAVVSLSTGLGPELPPWLLSPAYMMVAWGIGMRFTPDILASVARALPVIVGSIFLLILVSVAIAAAMVFVGGIDPLTAYLAASPGGADTVAVIAASSHGHIDVPFVMAMQMLRFLVVLLIGPRLARWVAEKV